MSDDEAAKLISSGKVKILKYFPKDYIKKGYALFKKYRRKTIYLLEAVFFINVVTH